jgi:predicted small integral membrane protein
VGISFILIPTITNVIAIDTNKMMLFMENILSMSTIFPKESVMNEGKIDAFSTTSIFMLPDIL